MKNDSRVNNLFRDLFIDHQKSVFFLITLLIELLRLTFPYAKKILLRRTPFCFDTHKLFC